MISTIASIYARNEDQASAKYTAWNPAPNDQNAAINIFLT